MVTHIQYIRNRSRSNHAHAITNTHNTKGTIVFVLSHNITTLSYNITRFYIAFVSVVALTWASDRVECSYYDTSTG